MDQDLFKKLPSEILMNILLRLPAQSTLSCKCVCKPWLDLLSTDEFVKSHLSKSIPHLAVCQEINPMKICVFDELGLEHPCNTFFNFTIAVYKLFHSSVNGLLFLGKHDCPIISDLFVCNPITREYISLPCPPLPASRDDFVLESYGFGVSKTTCHYKLVRIFHLRCLDTSMIFDQSKCQVYTLGMGFWRNIKPSRPFYYGLNRKGVFMNGNLHWLMSDGMWSPWISCFDVETELFSTFVAPSLPSHPEYYRTGYILSALKDCLCLCDNSAENEIVIWLMKQYGDGNSWTKEFVISRTMSLVVDRYGPLRPVKVYENGDILIEDDHKESSKILCYSNKTNTIQRIGLLELYDGGGHDCTKVITYTPSLISLKTFTMEMRETKSRRKRKAAYKSKMEHDLFKYLPSASSQVSLFEQP